jgi:hypothetical protein
MPPFLNATDTFRQASRSFFNQFCNTLKVSVFSLQASPTQWEHLEQHRQQQLSRFDGQLRMVIGYLQNVLSFASE